MISYLCKVKVAVLHKVFSVSLAILVLFSTVSFTVEKHFCGDTLIDVSVFTEAQKCDMEQTTITKKTCCKDTVDVIKGQDELTLKKFENLTFHQQVFLATFTYAYVNLFEDLPRQIIPHKNYSPPNIVRDIHVLDEVYII